MEEKREQPASLLATALDKADENEVAGRVGSQDNLGKFKSVQALMDAYESLQSEFTKKCQQLSQYQKDKTDTSEDKQNSEEKVEDQNEEGFNQEEFVQFLSDNDRAREYAEEIKNAFGQISQKQKSPYQVAWESVVANHLKQANKAGDPIINEYVLSDENVRNKIIESYIQQISSSAPPLTLSSGRGQSVAQVMPQRPQTLADAKKIVDQMFS